MPNRDALLRLRETLLARRADLRNKLTRDLANLRDFKAADSTYDDADAAFEASSHEMSSQLAEMDVRELRQIDRALARLTQGRYGVCEGGSEKCQIKIPLARLKVLPFTTLCINCERELERYPDWHDRRGTGNWELVFDGEAALGRKRIKFSELEMELCSKR
jgi:DnaK suppressor protein